MTSCNTAAPSPPATFKRARAGTACSTAWRGRCAGGCEKRPCNTQQRENIKWALSLQGCSGDVRLATPTSAGGEIFLDPFLLLPGSNASPKNSSARSCGEEARPVVTARASHENRNRNCTVTLGRYQENARLCQAQRRRPR